MVKPVAEQVTEQKIVIDKSAKAPTETYASLKDSITKSTSLDDILKVLNASKLEGAEREKLKVGVIIAKFNALNGGNTIFNS